MNLDTARKILKYFGIINIVLGVLTLLLGIAGVAVGGAAADTAASNTEASVNSMTVIGAGSVLIFAAVLGCVDGILSVLASKNNKYGLAAMIFAIFNICTALYNIFTALSKGGSVVSPVCNLVTALLLCYCANMVRIEYNSKKQ